jgi:hypothetical protein
MEVTVSGVPKARRGALRAIIEALHGVYSGELSVGRTAAVVVEGAVDWAAPKLAAAAEHGIPIVSYEWLLDSEVNGFLLHVGPYTLSAQDGRRSSAASSSALQRDREQSDATGAAAAPAPAWQIVEGAGNPTAHAATPASAERLRAAVHPLPDYLPGMLHGDSSPARSPAGMSHSDSNLQHQQALVPDFAVLALPSPVSPTQMHQASTAAACLHAGCSPLLPLLPDVPEAAAGCGQESSKQLPAASHGPLQLDWETAAGGQGSAGTSSQQFPAADQPGKQHPPGAEAPPAAGLSTQSHQAVAATPAVVSAGTDSDGKVARILSRMTHVTLARGSCLPRWQRPPSPDSCESLQRDRGGSSAGSGSTGSRSSSPLGSLRGRGSAEHPGSNRRGSFHVKEMGGHAERDVGSTQKIAAEQPGPLSVGATGTRCMFQPDSGDEEAQQLDEHAQERQVRDQQGQKEEEQGSLPASTLIRLGPQLPRPPSGSIFEEMAARHGGTSFTAEQRRGVTFHDSATALLLGGKELMFVAGVWVCSAAPLLCMLVCQLRRFLCTQRPAARIVSACEAAPNTYIHTSMQLPLS